MKGVEGVEGVKISSVLSLSCDVLNKHLADDGLNMTP